MKFTLEYPSEVPTAADGFLAPEVMTAFAVHAEDCGFDAIALSDHPAPSVKWRHGGGHETLEPAIGLTYFAGKTTRLRLLTNLYVLPFRNPYLTAKTLTSLDIVSGGRLIAGVAAGYLRSEFSALGVDFERRAALLDESLAALVRIWTQPEEPVAGEDFAAVSPMWLQPPVSRPHPPIWIGGNGKAARRRVVKYGQGWCPVLTSGQMAAAIRTEPMSSAEQFGLAAGQLRAELTEAGRDPDSIDIQVQQPAVELDDSAAVQRAIDELGALADLGANWTVVHVDASSVDAASDYVSAFADKVIRVLGEQPRVAASSST